MKGIKSFSQVLLGVLLVGGIFWILDNKVYNVYWQRNQHKAHVTDTDFGLFLAGQHALYVNDFENVSKMMGAIKTSNESVERMKNIADFFGGKMPQNAALLKDSKDMVETLIYDAFLINKDDWKSVYNRHSKDKTIFAAPLRIFSMVHQGKTKEAYKFIDSLKTSEYWKAFVRGQIAVLTNDIDGAAKEFAKVHPEFMNINDYFYLMSFYRENGMVEDMEILRDDFLAKPGGMYMLNYSNIPAWSNYAGYKNNLVFSIVQNVSHTQIMIYTDLSLMFLRFAQVVSDGVNQDVINYYLGQYYFNNAGNYKKCFDAIDKHSPLYLFGKLTMYEKNNDVRAIRKIVRENPLFVPAVQFIVKDCIRKGDKHGALRVLNRALKQKNLSDEGEIFFLKQRAYVYLMFGDLSRAEYDLQTIKDNEINLSSDVLFLQVQLWTAQGRNLDDAYGYTMSLIKKNTSDLFAWNLLARIVAQQESVSNALEIMESVTATGVNVSSVYEHLGDLYAKQGDKAKALRAYTQAIDLSDDGLVVVPIVKKKIRKLK